MSAEKKVEVDIKIEDNQAPVEVEVNIDTDPQEAERLAAKEKEKEQTHTQTSLELQQAALDARVEAGEMIFVSPKPTSAEVVIEDKTVVATEETETPATPEVVAETATYQILERGESNTNKQQNENGDEEWGKDTQNQLASDLGKSYEALEKKPDKNTVVPVKRGDTLRAIVIALTKNGKRSQPVSYLSNRLEDNKKPKTLGEASYIEIGQYVWVKEGTIYVADTPDGKPTPPEQPPVTPEQPRVNINPASPPPAPGAASTPEVLPPSHAEYAKLDPNQIVAAINRYDSLDRPFEEIRPLLDHAINVTLYSNNLYIATAALELIYADPYREHFVEYARRLAPSGNQNIKDYVATGLITHYDYKQRIRDARGITWRTNPTFVETDGGVGMARKRLKREPSLLFTKREIEAFGFKPKDLADFMNRKKQALEKTV